MLRSIWLVVLALLPLAAAAEPPPDVDYAATFSGQTMRVDYTHCGTSSEEHFALQQVVCDGPWAGSTTQLVDELNLGKYLFEVRDGATDQLLYSRGFCSVYGEWETTGPARTQWGAFHESLRFPWPRKPVSVRLHKRVPETQAWQLAWSTDVDPDSRFVNPAPPPPLGERWEVFQNGPAAEKVDLVVLGDGYAPEELPEFREHVRRLVEALFAVEPFRGRRGEFNVWAVDSPSPASGVSRPHAGIFRRSRLSASYSTFDSERYVLTFDNRMLRDVVATAPYDFLVILVNERTYGGGGIHHDQTTVAARNAFADYLMVHEFGHHFAGLGDEYYMSAVAYETPDQQRPEPWEPNLTALLDPARLKWNDLVEPGTPLPTPWGKEVYETESRRIQETRQQLRQSQAAEEDLESLFQRERDLFTRLLGGDQHAGKVGAFEGGGYAAQGLYRPTVDCLMFTRNEVGFCPVCRRAIERVIDQYAR